MNQTGKKTIIDVRTPEEFSMGHVKGSINIPLHELEQRLEEIKQIEGEIILCCASGARSARAHRFLQQLGLTHTSNGGPWLAVEGNLFTHN